MEGTQTVQSFIDARLGSLEDLPQGTSLYRRTRLVGYIEHQGEVLPFACVQNADTQGDTPYFVFAPGYPAEWVSHPHEVPKDLTFQDLFSLLQTGEPSTAKKRPQSLSEISQIFKNRLSAQECVSLVERCYPAIYQPGAKETPGAKWLFQYSHTFTGSRQRLPPIDQAPPTFTCGLGGA